MKTRWIVRVRWKGWKCFFLAEMEEVECLPCNGHSIDFPRVNFQLRHTGSGDKESPKKERKLSRQTRWQLSADLDAETLAFSLSLKNDLNTFSSLDTLKPKWILLSSNETLVRSTTVSLNCFSRFSLCAPKNTSHSAFSVLFSRSTVVDGRGNQLSSHWFYCLWKILNWISVEIKERSSKMNFSLCRSSISLALSGIV